MRKLNDTRPTRAVFWVGVDACRKNRSRLKMSNAACFCRFPQHHCPEKTARLMRPIALLPSTCGNTTPSCGLFPTTSAFPQQNLGVSPQTACRIFHRCRFPQHSPRRFQLVKKQRAGVSMDLLATILAPKNGLFLGPPWISAVSPPLCELLSLPPPHPLY